MIRKENKALKWTLISISLAFLTVMLVLPLIFVVTTALAKGLPTFWAAITDRYARSAIWLTLEVTLIAVIVNTIFGLFAAWTITKYSFRGKKLLSALIDLPLTISPIIAGLIYLLTFGRQSFLYEYLQAMNIKIIFAVPGVVLATVFVTFPFISREIIPVLASQGKDEEEAAALMGAGFFRIFRTVTFPHIKWAFLYGVVLCTARALGEFGAVSVISGHLRGKTNTMPLYIELLYQGYDFTGAFAMSAILVMIAIIILIIRNILEYRDKRKVSKKGA